MRLLCLGYCINREFIDIITPLITIGSWINVNKVVIKTIIFNLYKVYNNNYFKRLWMRKIYLNLETNFN